MPSLFPRFALLFLVHVCASNRAHAGPYRQTRLHSHDFRASLVHFHLAGKIHRNRNMQSSATADHAFGHRACPLSLFTLPVNRLRVLPGMQNCGEVATISHYSPPFPRYLPRKSSVPAYSGIRGIGFMDASSHCASPMTCMSHQAARRSRSRLRITAFYRVLRPSCGEKCRLNAWPQASALSG